jgi:hypothetical protein
MPTMILVVITQEDSEASPTMALPVVPQFPMKKDSEPKLLPNANPTMALPVVPQVPRKKLLQMKLWAEDDAPAPELDFIQVPSHIRGSSSVRDHRRYANPAKSHDEQKKKGPSNPKRSLDKPSTFPKPKLIARRLFNWQTLCTSSI